MQVSYTYTFRWLAAVSSLHFPTTIEKIDFLELGVARVEDASPLPVQRVQLAQPQLFGNERKRERHQCA